MDHELRERIRGFDDEHLVEQYARSRHEYTEEAAAFMKEELAARGIGEDRLEAALESPPTDTPRRTYSRDEFAALELTFSHVDLLLAQTVLREHQIPFFVDLPPASSILPLEDEMERRYTIFVLRERHDEAREALGEHFAPSGQAFARKDAGLKERLRSFSFHEAPVGEDELEDEVDVRFSAQEKHLIAGYVERLLAEVDEVEKRLDRVVFYFDNLDDLHQTLTAAEEEPLRRTDLLAVLEVLQIYCGEDDFPAQLDTVAEGILSFLAA